MPAGQPVGDDLRHRRDMHLTGHQNERRADAAHRVRQAISYLGPGFFVTIGFIDPGNWATNVAAGSAYGYDLLWIITLSTITLMLWQHMSAHLGIVTGKCLAEAVREHVRPASALLYGATAMAACVATAVAEVLGVAIALEVLFQIPLRVGTLVAALAVGTMVWFQGYRSVEKLVLGFLAAIGLCYLVELWLVKPDLHQTALHLMTPRLSSQNILVAVGVLGAVVMPHNLYLHSEVIQRREWDLTEEAKTRRQLRYEFLDTLLAMLAGMLINTAMIVVAAAAFHSHHVVVTELPQAAETLRPIAGPLAGLVFAVGLLFAGVSSSITAAIAGGTVFSGYLGKETDLQGRWFRIGVVFTLVPAVIAIMLVHNPLRALILSQVCLSVQLPLTMLPLFLLTSSRRVMGKFANRALEMGAMVVTGLLIVALNGLLLWQLLGGRF
jgi:manganese transport protein